MSKFLKSFYYAFIGIKTAYLQINFKIHLVVSVLVIFFSFFFDISQIEWIIILFCIGLVLSAEIINTAIEEICDLLKLKLKLDYYDTWNPRNLGAGAVLVTALMSAVIGLIIFLPKITNLIR